MTADVFHQTLVMITHNLELARGLSAAGGPDDGGELSFFDGEVNPVHGLHLQGTRAKAADRKHIRIDVDCDSRETLWHDPKWTAEALGNLLDNAVK